MTMTTTRTTNGDRLLVFIRQYIAHHGYSPSVRDMVDGAGLSSTSVAYYWMLKLRDVGFITFVEGLSRTVRIADGQTQSDLVIWLTGDDATLFREAIPDGHDPEEVARDYLLQGARTMRGRWGSMVNGAPAV